MTITTSPSSTPTSPERYLTVAEVADLLGVSKMTVFRRIAAGQLLALRMSPRVIRIPQSAYDAYCGRMRMGPATPS